MAAEDGQDAVVAVLADEIDEELALVAHKLELRQLQHLSAEHNNNNNNKSQ